jgi:hypothetical protein
MARLELGPTLDQLRKMAEATIDKHYEPTRLRAALYTRKVFEARRHLAGETSDMLNREAQRKHIRSEVIAQQVIALAEADEKAEDDRIALKMKVRKALTAQKIRKLLADNGITLSR